MRAILMFHNCEGQSHKTVSTDNFWRGRRTEADSNQGPSSYQPNAVPLGQTGSHSEDFVAMGSGHEYGGGGGGGGVIVIGIWAVDTGRIGFKV